MPISRVSRWNALRRHKRVCGVVPLLLGDATADGGWGLGDESQRQRHVALKEAMMMAQMCENDLNRHTDGAAITVQRKLSPPEGDFDFERTISGGAPWFSRS